MALWGQTPDDTPLCSVCEGTFCGLAAHMPLWGGVLAVGWPECNTEAVEPVKLGSKNAVWGINIVFVISSIVSELFSSPDVVGY